MIKYNLFINGEFVETKEKQQIINPANTEVIAEVSIAQDKEVELALSSARTAFDSGPWPKLSLKERKEFLLKISQGILDKAAELALLETQNQGKPLKESTFMDIPSSAKVFEYLASNLEEFLKTEKIEISNEISKAKAALVREPLGVALLIVPWNYPLLIACWKLALALAAGNTVILKPSSLTPLSVLELAKIIKDAGLPRGVVNIINASGANVGKQLCSDKRVDIISFTGSNEVGKSILEYSCVNVKKLIMELGGKSAAIVLDDVDLEIVTNSLLCSIFLNQGQMCTAMSRFLVHERIYAFFVEKFVEKAKRIQLGIGEDFQTQMGPLISKSQRDKVIDFIERAKKEGAKIFCGGSIPKNSSLKNGFFFEPTVLIDLSSESEVFYKEVFGPVVVINKFDTIKEAVTLANKSDFALAASIWTKDGKKAQEISSQINAGTVWINTYGMFFNELPYGGFKQSGFGKELGKSGFLEFSRLKNILKDCSDDAKPLVNYWYGF